MSIKTNLKTHRAAYLLLTAIAVVAALLVLAPAFATSTNPCSPCHGAQGYSQTLSITPNQVPSSLNVGQIATVSAVIKNEVSGTTTFVTLRGISASLNSQNGHFSVSEPTVSAGNLTYGSSATVSWQITGVSAGSDSIVVTANASNRHENLSFTDGFTSSAFAVEASAPTQTASPTVTPPAPTQTPTPSHTPTPTPTPTPTSTHSTTTTPTETATTDPTATQTPTTTPNPTLEPATTPPTNPTTSTQPTPQTANTPKTKQAQMLPQVLYYGAIPFAILTFATGIILISTRMPQPKKPMKNLNVQTPRKTTGKPAE
jgi:hypothetical protein